MCPTVSSPHPSPGSRSSALESAIIRSSQRISGIRIGVEILGGRELEVVSIFYSSGFYCKGAVPGGGCGVKALFS